LKIRVCNQSKKEREREIDLTNQTKPLSHTHKEVLCGVRLAGVYMITRFSNRLLLTTRFKSDLNGLNMEEKFITK
jgi:hypothetical protein